MARACLPELAVQKDPEEHRSTPDTTGRVNTGALQLVEEPKTPYLSLLARVVHA